MQSYLLAAIAVLLALVFHRLHSINRSNIHMTAALDRLTASVAALTAVDASAVALISGLAAQIRENVDDSDALNALADNLDAQNSALATAVSANTPAAPAPTTQPDPAIDPAPMDTTNSGVDTLAGANGNDSVPAGDDTVEG